MKPRKLSEIQKGELQEQIQTGGVINRTHHIQKPPPSGPKSLPPPTHRIRPFHTLCITKPTFATVNIWLSYSQSLLSDKCTHRICMFADFFDTFVFCGFRHTLSFAALQLHPGPCIMTEKEIWPNQSIPLCLLTLPIGLSLPPGERVHFSTRLPFTNQPKIPLCLLKNT